ncbi:MAG: cytochrome c oxidase assembly protein [Actinobacteria bacterium]|nr:cytochrome c oxidase assembly protein [Actinomycetota bacterium]MCL6104421.1 cytochrome c oxidase assembly protein [Actinomycetota bacterium]
MTAVVVSAAVSAPTVALVVVPTVHLTTLLTRWQFDPLSLAAYLVEATVLLLYLWGVRRLKQKGGHWSYARSLSFISGIFVVVVALGSGLASYDDSVFTMHVVQHILLMNLAPPLLALGSPVMLMLQTSPRSVRRRMLKVLHGKTARFLSHPAVLSLANYGTMYSYFLTPLYILSIRNNVYHAFVHMQFLLVGCIFWWPLVGTDPMPARRYYPIRLAVVALGIPFDSFLGIIIMSFAHPISPNQTVVSTQTGGEVLWILLGLSMLGGTLVVAYQWMKAEERKSARQDRRFGTEFVDYQASYETHYK